MRMKHIAITILAFLFLSACGISNPKVTFGKKCVKKIEPLFNRMIAFDTHDYSYHGLPNPINFPKSKLRKSLILYYYTSEKRPKNQIKVSKPHSALWLKKKVYQFF